MHGNIGSSSSSSADLSFSHTIRVYDSDQRSTPHGDSCNNLQWTVANLEQIYGGALALCVYGARKKISDGKSGLPENLPLPVESEKRISAKFRIFRFQNSKIKKKIIKKENRIFRPDFVAFRSDFGAFRSENIVLAM